MRSLREDRKIPLLTRRGLLTLTIIAHVLILSLRFTAEIYGFCSYLCCWPSFFCWASHVKNWRLELHCVKRTICCRRPSTLRDGNAWGRRLALFNQAGVIIGADNNSNVWNWIELGVGKVRDGSGVVKRQKWRANGCGKGQQHKKIINIHLGGKTEIKSGNKFSKEAYISYKDATIMGETNT